MTNASPSLISHSRQTQGRVGEQETGEASKTSCS